MHNSFPTRRASDRTLRRPTKQELTLYHAIPSRSSIAHWMLEEVGRPYEIRVLDLKKGENQTPEYLAVNPMGKVPALLHGGVAVTEASAICCYLADDRTSTRLNSSH